jgi:hypothetical protein
MSLNRLAALVAVAALAAACNPPPSTAPASPSPTSGSAQSVAPPTSVPASPEATQDSTGIYSLIRDQVEAIRGLEPTADVEPVTIDETQLAENLEVEIDAQQTPEEMAISEDLLGALGLIPEDSSIKELTLDLLAGQVAGYYSPERDELFVVSRTGQTVGPVERATYAHEFTHQLQDQTYDLGSLDTTSVDQSDRALAQLALIEGDATWVQLEWLQANLTPEELGELLAASLDPEALEALNNAPAYLRETSLFPYQDGLALVQRLILEGGGGYDAVDAAFDDPPDSTEQVLHPNKYVQREAPIEVRIPNGIAGQVGDGWTEAVRDTLGELILRIWLTEHNVSPEGARMAAEGWGGDRLVLLRSDDGSVAIGLKTTWDTADDALEFATALLVADQDPAFNGEVFHRGGTSDVLVAIGDDAAQVLAALRS